MHLRLPFAAIGLLVLSGFAFWPQYLSKLRSADGYTHAHAALGSAWLLILAVQPLLISAGKLAIHRVTGRLGCFVGAAFVVSGILVAHRGLTRMGAEEFAKDGHSLYLPLVMAGVFAAALWLGVAWRGVMAVHSRFMACTALPLLDPLFARILYIYFPPLPAVFLAQVPAFLTASVVLILLARSLPGATSGHATFRWFAGGTIVAFLLFFITPFSSSWLGFVTWFRSLPIT